MRSTTEKLTRLDLNEEMKKKLLKYCRLKPGNIWEDKEKGHRVGVLDATKKEDIDSLVCHDKAVCQINDPPYNVKAGNRNTKDLFKIDIDEYISFSRKWIKNSFNILSDNSHFYLWIGADYKDSFRPLPEIMLLMRNFKDLKARNFITLRNQRGYGTQKNWMWIRQELIHYIKGSPQFYTVYTDIPKVLKGYYKVVNGKRTENLARSRSKTIRPGNVWIDIQQVFYRMKENVPGCYAQKPLLSIERIIKSSSKEKDLVVDLFSHSGTTLISGERLGRKVYTCDIDPVYAEITIRRLELFRKKGQLGWQWETPFPELD